MTATRWSDNTFLDKLKSSSDNFADAALKQMIKDGEIGEITRVFREMNANDDLPMQEKFPALAYFAESTDKMPAGIDLERIQDGEEVFLTHAFPAALVLLAKSLVEGYSAPRLTEILHYTRNLDDRTYRRLLQVLQMLLNVGACRGFEKGGKAMITAQKIRLMHAGIRHVIDQRMPEYVQKYGIPVNLEDMLATIMGFSLLVIDGLRMLNSGLTTEEEEDYYYLWQVFAQMCGIYPADQADSFDYIPASVDEAREFYDAYSRRHYTGPQENPAGELLARDNLRMLREMIPRWLRWTGLGLAPRIYTWHLVGKEGCQRVNIRPIPGHSIFKWLLFRLPHWWVKLTGPLHKVERRLSAGPHVPFAQLIFQHLIKAKFGGEVTFTIPTTLDQIRGLVSDKLHAHTPG